MMPDNAPLAISSSKEPIQEPQKEPVSLIRMRRTANGLLVLMTALFFVSHLWGGHQWWWGYIRAFAEAAMVGGLADWFAVTAIFRRPLGLPIPHTAVIPRNQPRIADAVGRFIADNFLAPDLVAERVKDKDLSEGLGKWLADPSQSGALASGLVSAVPQLLDALDDETVAAFLRKQASSASGASIAPAFGSVLDALAQQGRHQAILDALLKEGFRLLDENQYLIRARVHERTGWFMRMFDADKKAADSLINGLADLLSDVAADGRHPLRLRITEMVTKFASDLRDDPALQQRIEHWIREAAGHPSVTGAVEAGWTEFKAALRRDCVRPQSRLRQWLSGALVNLGSGLLQDGAVREALNGRIRSLLVQLAERHGEDVARLVSDTIRAWDARTVVEQLETTVGRDLQFIRLNGTIIGGLVGVGLHAGAMVIG